MQNSHRDNGIELPAEWGGMRWPRGGARVVPVDDPGYGYPQDADAWRWGEGFVLAGGETYDPVPQAAEIFDAALRVAPDDETSVLAFIRAWGPLRWGQIPLWTVRRTFREVQRHFAWSRALRGRDWRSPAVPSVWGDRDAFMGALRAVLPPPEHGKLAPPWRHASGWPDLVVDVGLSTDLNPYPDPYIAAFVKGHLVAWHARTKVRVRDREEAHWRAFATAITEHLRAVHPTLGWTGRPVAAWRVPRLEDLLWIELWNLVSGGAAIRQCRHCKRWFAVDRRGKVYCSRICTNRASAAASYAARKTTRRRRAR